MKPMLFRLLVLAMFAFTGAMAGCGLDDGPPTGTDDEKSNAGLGSYYDQMTITCERTSSLLNVTITGPVQDGVFSPLTSGTVYIEYGSDTDGWDAYGANSKPRVQWTGDWSSNYYSTPQTFTMALPAATNNFNFFLYRQSDASKSWFDLNRWTIRGSCYRDNGGIRQTSTSGGGGGTGSGSAGTISCTAGSSALSVAINGNFTTGVFGGPPPNADIRLEYGSDIDGWGGYYGGNKAQAPWYPSKTDYVMSLPPSMSGFNFFLFDTYTTDRRWFDLAKWSIVGDCQLANDGRSIVRYGAGTPPVSGLSISCQRSGSDIVYTIGGEISSGLVSPVPYCPNGTILLEYGSDTDGWVPYTSGKQYGYYQSSTTSTQMRLSSNVQSVNFFLYCPTNGQSSWFDLNKWSYSGVCSRSAGQNIYHQ